MVFHLRTTTISDPLKKLRRHLYTNIYTRLDIQKKTFLENLGKSSEQCVLWEGNELNTRRNTKFMCWYEENLSSFPSLVLVSKLPKISGVPCNYFENFSTLMGYFSHFRFALKLYHDAKKKQKQI